MIVNYFFIVTHIGFYMTSLEARARCHKTHVRQYYIAAVEVEWDYASTGHNLINGDDDAASTFIGSPTDKRIGSKYKKVVYRQYTDESFLEEVPHESWLGVLGPIIKAEVGDTLVVLFKNLASIRNFTMHPHGVFYTKDSEGAMYADGTRGNDKADDSVPPGGTHTYIWNVTTARRPRDGDPSCQTWIYHSHVHAEHDTNTGLIGTLLICKEGTLDAHGHRLDVDREYVLMFTVMDENFNWYLDDNIHHYLTHPPENIEELKQDADFQEQNKKHSINGYLFGNLPELNMCLGENISWHLFGLGNEVDLHTAYFHGNTFITEHHRTDVISLFPAIFKTGVMVAANPGKWLLSCQVHDHIEAGMQAFYEVKRCNNSHQQTEYPESEVHQQTESLQSEVPIREYFIAAQEIEWDYAPSGKNILEDILLEEDEDGIKYATHTNHFIGRKYTKVKFVQYQDETFSRKIPPEEFLGILGPIIRAEVGELIKINFWNNASRPYSIISHGVFYNKQNEGAKYNDGTQGSYKTDDSVPPGNTFTYVWRITEDVAPTQLDPNCLTWWYTSGVDTVKDSQSGLNGILLTCKPGTLNESGKQIGVDEVPLMFTIFDENKSWYLSKNIKRSSELQNLDPENLSDDVKESNRKFSINGYIFGNLKGIKSCKGKTISWHVLGMGNEADIHTVYFHGNNFYHHGQNLDSIIVLPGVGYTLSMKTDNVGNWALECRTDNHLQPGMRAMYEICNCQSSNDLTTSHGTFTTGHERIYYIGAIERLWNYMDEDFHIISEDKLTENEGSKIFVTRDETHIGSEYKKVLFRQFKDASFRREVLHPDYLGIMGPIIKAEVGDTIKVVFKNFASHNYSIHPHGVMYNKSNEGWFYNDGNSYKRDDIVNPGATYTYLWTVPERAGPAKNDFNCATWSYYSAVNPQRDTNSGLIGPLIVCRRGTLTRKGRRKDVNKEFALLFTIFDENLSWYLQENINTYCSDAINVKPESEDFQESNKKHSINGRLFGRKSGLTMKQNKKVAWYLIGMGSDIDIHTIHFHGQTFLRFMDSKHVNDVISVFPGIFTTVEMIPDSPGTWLLHCHVNDHSVGGMTTLFIVEPANQGHNLTHI